MLDDYTKVCAVVPMKGRKAGMTLLRDFVTRVETQLGDTVRFIRSDNGPEYHLLDGADEPLNGAIELWVVSGRDLMYDSLGSIPIVRRVTDELGVVVGASSSRCWMTIPKCAQWCP
jgi:hypothetical protein